MVWAPRLHGEPGGPASITGTARFVPATFYIASLPFQDTPQIGGSARGYLGIDGHLSSPGMAYWVGVCPIYLCIATLGATVRICRG